MLASSTTFLLREARRVVPGWRARLATSILFWMTESSWSFSRLRAAVARHSCSWERGQSLPHQAQQPGFLLADVTDEGEER